MVHISEKISSLRKARNLTQEALGEAVGVSPQAVSKWEKGDSLPDISVIPDLCRTFGISADALLGNEGNMTSEMYVEKALELCKDTDEKMRMLHKIMHDGPNSKNQSAAYPHIGMLLWAGHIFSLKDSRGFGMFLSNIEYLKNMMSVDLTGNNLLNFMSDEKAIKIFMLICLNGVLDDNEIIKMTGFSEHEVTQRLFAFMKCSVIEPYMGDKDKSETSYAVSDNGIFLLGIIINASLFQPESRKKTTYRGHRNFNPDKFKKFISGTPNKNF